MATTNEVRRASEKIKYLKEPEIRAATAQAVRDVNYEQDQACSGGEQIVANLQVACERR